MLGLGLLGLHELGDAGQRWLVVDVLWATAAAIAIGIAAGTALARMGWHLRSKPHGHELMDDFLGLGLIGVVYGLCVLVDAWGFLAVFVAAVALRQSERKLARTASPELDGEALPTVSEGSLIFKEHLERLSEMVLVILLGGTLFVDSWSWAAVGLSLFLFVVARPLSVVAGLAGSGTPWRIRALVGWFGVRGMGSLYYLMFAIQRGLPEDLALQLIQLTLIVVTLSIVLHGTSVKPLLALFWRRGA
jgi:NhaP-type Na+/H+ or K+/H+ antiporter